MKKVFACFCVLLLLCSLLSACVKKEECTVCEGTGVCSRCDGSGFGGYIVCNQCHGLEPLIPYCTNFLCKDGYVSRLGCENCSEKSSQTTAGSGLCYFCDGKGYVEY